MLKTFLRQNVFKHLNIRQKCDLNCKERHINLISQQTESLNIISKHTQVIAFITILNFMSPLILIGATGVSSVINKLLH